MPPAIRDLIVGRAADEALAWFDLGAADAAEVRGVAATIAADEALSGELTQIVASLRRGLGVPRPWDLVELPKRYDPMDPGAAVLDRWWYTVAALAFVPETLAYHRARGVAEHTSRATLADLGRHARIHARTYGRSGLATESWIQLHLRGLLYDLGRLQFNLTTLRLPAAMMAAAGMAAEPGDVVLDTHIPETGPLTPDEVTASLGRARGFFAAHFPEHAPYRWALCHSWLLDPQLSTLLPGSNIDAFCRRWTVLDPGVRADQSALDFIFRMPGVPLGSLPRDTRLQRAVVDHLSNGGHLHQTLGFLPI